jgi:hypothetical protein
MTGSVVVGTSLMVMVAKHAGDADDGGTSS